MTQCPHTAGLSTCPICDAERIEELEAEVEALRYERAQAGKRAMLAESINEELKSELADCQARVEATKKILIEALSMSQSADID